MGRLTERIEEIRGQNPPLVWTIDQPQTPDERAEAVPAATELRVKQAQEVDAMVVQQRMLFNELDEIGLIEMLEEMTDGYEIHPAYTKAEQEERQAKFLANYKENVSANSVRIQAEDRGEIWKAETVKPAHDNRGNLGSTLQIKLTKAGYRERDVSHWSQVLITYSEDKTLRIYGADTEYVGRIDADINMETLEKGLAYAFAEPAEMSSGGHFSGIHTTPRRRIRSSVS